MPINFPTSLDALSNPAAGDATNNVTTPHATQHANSNDAIEALEARVGITGSAVTSSLTFRLAAVETSTALITPQGAWTSWTPVVVQGATPTLTNTSTKYQKVSRMVTASCTVTLTSAGTAANVISCTLPFNCAAANGNAVGTFVFGDTGTTTYAGIVVLASATTCGFFVGGSGAGYLGVTPAVTIANTDTLNFTITYEATT